MFNKKPNDGVHIHRIVSETTCDRHAAGVGTPCWTIFATSVQELFPAICSSRIKSFGFDGKISSMSLSQRSPARHPAKKPFVK